MNFQLQICGLFVLLLTITACNQNEVHSQSNRPQGETNSNQLNSASNLPIVITNNAETETGTQNKKGNGYTLPYYGLIMLEKPLKKESLVAEDRNNLKTQFRWGDVCDLDSSVYFVNENSSSVTFHKLQEKQYLVEVMCQGGASKIGYLFYYYNEQTDRPTARLMKFEWYEGYNSQKTIGRVVSFNPVGSATFVDADKKLNIFRGSGGADDEEISFTFSNGKATLVEMKEKSDNFWKKLDITKFRQTANKTRTVNAFEQ
jgi:hypothetical protein